MYNFQNNYSSLATIIWILESFKNWRSASLDLLNLSTNPTILVFSIPYLVPPCFELKSQIYQHHSFDVVNSRGLKLKGSYVKERHSVTARDTIIFLHANGSCRLMMYQFSYKGKTILKCSYPFSIWSPLTLQGVVSRKVSTSLLGIIKGKTSML